jgi:rhodanese-related sulfurtransferase
VFGAVVVVDYLWRPLLPVIVASVAPGGLLLYETVAVGNECFGRPRNPDFLLRPGELRDAVRGELDVLDLNQRRMRAPRHAACMDTCVRVAAGETTTVEDVDVTWPLAEAAARGFRVVDIRERYECAAEPMPIADHESVAMGRLLAGGLPDDASARYLLVCAHGIRSRAAAEALRALGRNNVWSLRGGLAAAGGRGASEGEVVGRQRHQ